MICVSIIEQSKNKCIEILKQCEMAELRFDLMQPKLSDIKHFFAVDIPIIATCRKGEYTYEQRYEILKKAIECGAKYIDIELEANDDYKANLMNIAQKNGCKVLISYHNYENTPDINYLQNILQSIRKYKSDYAKIVTMAHNSSDVARVLSLYENEENILAFAMGDCGKMSRLTSLELGAPFVYAAFEQGKESANGQMTMEQIQKIRSLLL